MKKTKLAGCVADFSGGCLRAGGDGFAIGPEDGAGIPNGREKCLAA